MTPFKRTKRFGSTTTRPEGLTEIPQFAVVDGLGFVLVEQEGTEERFAVYPQRRLALRALEEAQAARLNAELWVRP